MPPPANGVLKLEARGLAAAALPARAVVPILSALRPPPVPLPGLPVVLAPAPRVAGRDVARQVAPEAVAPAVGVVVAPRGAGAPVVGALGRV
jgi:hypothetical protein